jgi:photosystem II stability/assembly factor-like uncharacterized protein
MGAETVAAAIPNVYTTTDGGDTIAIAASGFPATSSILALTCVDTPDGMRLVAARENIAGLAAGVETALWGGAWADVIVGDSADEGPLKSTAMFFLDYRHGWLCTDEGRVYFSGDAGLSWAEQESAYVATGGDILRAIHFSDAMTGYAVGLNDRIISTTDGGDNWTGSTTGLGEAWLCLHVFDRQRLIIGSYSIVGSGGNLFMSYNAGTNWLDVSRWPVVTGVTVGWDVHFLPDGLTGYLTVNIAGSSGSVYKSINGGYDWRRLETPANVWLQSLQVCKPNLGYVVGTVHAGTSFIAKFSG